MSSEEKSIELRISHSGNPYVAVLGGHCPKFGFQRIFNPFPRRCVRLPDGRKDEIHSLPDATLTYEVEEVRHGQRIRSYVATVEGDPNVYRISRAGAELLARKAMPIRRVIDEYPEMPLIEVEEE